MDDRLDEIKARLAAADWPLMEARRDRNTHNRDTLWAAVSVDDFEGRFPQWLGDRERAEWFVNAPADLAYLIAEVERLRDLAAAVQAFAIAEEQLEEAVRQRGPDIGPESHRAYVERANLRAAAKVLVG